MDFNKLREAVYAESWVGNYLEAMVKDLPQHKNLLNNFNVVSAAFTTLRREVRELEERVSAAQNALNG